MSNMDLVNDIHNMEAKLSPAELASMHADLQIMRKQPVTAWLYFFTLGAWGLHRYYIGKTGTAFIMFFLTLVALLSSVLGIAMSVSGWQELLKGNLPGSPFFLIGMLCGTITFVWLIIDFFRLPHMLISANLNLRHDMLDGQYDV